VQHFQLEPNNFRIEIRRTSRINSLKIETRYITPLFH